MCTKQSLLSRCCENWISEGLAVYTHLIPLSHNFSSFYYAPNLPVFSSGQSISLLEPWVNFFSFMGVIVFLTCEKVQHWQVTKEYRFQIVDNLMLFLYLLHILTVREPHTPWQFLSMFAIVQRGTLYFTLLFCPSLPYWVQAWVLSKCKRLEYFLSSRSSVRLRLCHTSSFSATQSSATRIEKATYDLFSNLCHEIINDSDRKGDLWLILQVWHLRRWHRAEVAVRRGEVNKHFATRGLKQDDFGLSRVLYHYQWK